MSLLSLITRTVIGRTLIGWIFAHLSFAIPVKRLRETDKLMAFYHPEPSYPVHVLLVPKKSIRNLADLSEEDFDFIHDVFTTTQALVDELAIGQSGYRLILNGGNYQEVPQMHFHLVSEAKTTAS